MNRKLDPAVVTRFNQWFQSRVRNPCPFCDSRDWTVHDEMAVTSTVEPDTHQIETTHGAPVVQITCNHCAFTASFSAVRMGLMEPDSDEG